MSEVRSVSNEFEFEYDYDVSWETNFRRWHEADTLEKESYGEKPYSYDQARAAFEKLYDLFEKTPKAK